MDYATRQENLRAAGSPQLAVVGSIAPPDDPAPCPPVDPTDGPGRTDDAPAKPSPVGDAAAWDGASFLPPAEPAPDAPARPMGEVVGDLTVAIARVVILLCFRAGIRCFNAALVWAEVPEPKPAQKRLNGLGDLLGRGAGRRSFRLWPGAGTYACCRQNAVIALRKLPPESIRAVAAELGHATPADLAAAVERLPRFEDLATA